jgi:hypothetical protein
MVINGLVGRPINQATRIFPRGFSHAREDEQSPASAGYKLFLRVGGDLMRVLENDVIVMGQGMEALRVDDARVGVRGSSVTGCKWSNPDISFNSRSDIDFFIESAILVKGFRVNEYGMAHPDAVMAYYPVLADWSEKWQRELSGRKITPAVFERGRLPDAPAIIVERAT